MIEGNTQIAEDLLAIGRTDLTDIGANTLVAEDFSGPGEAEQLWQGVAERTALGRAALIETHRESFIAADDAVEHALLELVRALRGLVKRHPDVCFLSPAALVDAFEMEGSPLLLHGVALRLSFFLRRLLVTSALSRGLKLSGLRFLIPVFIRVLTTVKPAQDTCRAGC